VASGCEKCDGIGWRQVGRPYAEHLASERHDREVDERRWLERVATFLNSYYPCRDCNASMFFRWHGGHLAADHVASDCADCVDAGASRRRVGAAHRPRAHASGPPPQTEPPEAWDDLDGAPVPTPAATLDYTETRRDLDL
jgi:hypothetical protein